VHAVFTGERLLSCYGSNHEGSHCETAAAVSLRLRSKRVNASATFSSGLQMNPLF
jgi:hypothetical protein